MGVTEGTVVDAGNRGVSKDQEDKFVALLAFVTQVIFRLGAAAVVPKY